MEKPSAILFSPLEPTKTKENFKIIENKVVRVHMKMRTRQSKAKTNEPINDYHEVIEAKCNILIRTYRTFLRRTRSNVPRPVQTFYLHA